MEDLNIDGTLLLTDQGIYDGGIEPISLTVDGAEHMLNHTDDEKGGSNRKKVMIDETLSLTDRGIYDGEIEILPLVIDGVEVIHNYTDDGDPRSPGQADGQAAELKESNDTTQPKVTCRYSLRSADTDMDVPVTYSYDPEDPQAFLKELGKKTGIRPRPKDEARTKTALRELFRFFTKGPATPDDPFPIPIKRTYISNRSGWHCIDGRWIYLTSGFGITADGIDHNWHCTAPNAHLHFDPTLTAEDAYLKILDLLDLDFRSTALVLTSAILGVLRPLRKLVGQKQPPSLLISGPTSSGKTQLAVGLTHILTDKNGDLEEVFLLQDTPKRLERATLSLSDTTLILDDIRHSPSANVNDKIRAVLDMTVRDCYLTSRLLPILTGESGALKHLPRSLDNRWIELLLDPSPEALAARKRVIDQLHKEPLLIRTFFRHLISFLADFLESIRGQTDFPDPEVAFTGILPYPEPHSRSYDNLQVSYWAFDIFLKYGRWLGALSDENDQAFTKRYIDILKEISERQDLLDPVTQATSIFLALIKKMNIQGATTLDNPGYTIKNGFGTKHYPNTYGHQALLNLYRGYSGVYIEDSTLLADYPKDLVPRTLLVMAYEKFETRFSRFSETCRDATFPFPYESFSDFRKELRNNGILLGMPRYDPDHPEYADYKINGYPCYVQDRKIGQTSVLVFKLKGALREQIRSLCEPNDNPAYGYSVNAQDVEACARCLAPLRPYTKNP